MAEKENKNISESSLIGLVRKLEKSANMGFWEKNLLTGDYYWSDQFYEIFGLDPEKDSPSESLRLSCIHPEDREKSKTAYQNAIETGQSFKIEKRILRPDGEIRHIISESHIEKNEEGLPIKVYGIIKDISAEKFLQEKAERKKRELQSFFKNSKDLLIELDWDGVIQNISESSYQNLGYHPDELIGKYLKDLVFPEDLPETMQAARKVRSGEIVSNFKNRYIHKNGGIVNLEWSITTDPEYQVLFLIARNINENFKLENETKGLLERLNRAQKIAKLGYWELDMESRKLFWSDEIYRIWEISSEFEPDFNFFKSTIHPEDRDDFLATQDQALSESKPLDYVHRIILKDGKIKFVHERANIDFNPKTGKQVFRGTVQDITEEKLIENELKSRNHFIESALENISIGVAVNEISSGKATFMNNAFSEIYGWPKSTIKDVESFFKSAYPDPEYRAKISQQIMSDMQSGDPNRMQWQDIFITTQDGKQRVVSAKNIPILDQDLMISTVWDETDRYWAEQTLKKSNERFHLATEAITDAIFDWNILGKKIFWGKGYHHLFGYPEEMQYVPEGFWESCVHPDDLPQILEDIQKARKDPNAKKWEGNYRFKKADGTYAFVKEQTSIQRDKTGKAIRIVGALQDISQRKRYEESLKTLNQQLMISNRELEVSNKELEQFAYVASHDLQEPLRMISSFLGLIEKKYDEVLDEKGRQYISFAVEGAKRMRSIILDLLDFSRLKEASESKKWIPMSQIMEEVLLLNKKLIRDSGAKIVATALPTVYGQESGLIQLFNNLISNAIKYRKEEEKPKIKITAEEHENHWQFTVADNGIGIDPKYLDKIFIIFQRLHGREQYPGSGIGLSICKKITEIHGGKIWVESTLGEGSTFHFTLQKPKNE
ncbi:PAS domain-containing protein [Algoriphagus formosus]|uniref:histidine kinase n=1 Tax=Algoriphagus formosus TaxID=2007308 RepID=A0A4R5V5M2_9BACT|nr:PAS domain-containing protein [Algoriphagus aquimaris]TDK47272.1 PAS domain S-box protein [Algoriphagus aquimaris]